LPSGVVQFAADSFAFFFLGTQQVPRQLRIAWLWRGQFARRASFPGPEPAGH
jgi:hypothetical protein